MEIENLKKFKKEGLIKITELENGNFEIEIFKWVVKPILKEKCKEYLISQNDLNNFFINLEF